MPKYIVTTTGTWRNIVGVEAESAEEAKELADDALNQEDIEITGVDEADAVLEDS